MVLREAHDDDAIHDVVRAYLQGFVREDLGALSSLLTSDATLLGSRGRVGAPLLVESWRSRLRSLEYGRLDGLTLVRPDRVERFEYDELGGANPPRPAEMRPGDVYVRARVEAPRANGERYFGEVVVFLLRRDEGKLRIAGVAEEDAS